MKKFLLLAALLCATSIFASDGASLYSKTCATCHGSKAEKSALNKSLIIAGWSSLDTITALNGYKNGSYGGPMKGVMKSNVQKLSAEDITALATYIEKIK